jgi:hypothetical protein
MFEWEQRRASECKMLKIIFIDSMRLLEAKIREELLGDVW